MSRPKLSVCIVAMNVEDDIGRCIDSVDFADEIVVVDSHSTDRTREIADEKGARVLERDWPGFIEQKNFALEQAEHDWVLCVDADEWLSPPLREAILAALERPQLPVGFEFARCTRYLGRIRHGGWYPDRKLRLFRRSKGRWGGEYPHDHVFVEGPVERLPGDLLHNSYRTLGDHLRTVNSFTDIAARGKHAKGRRAGVVDLSLRPAWKFLRMYVLRGGFLDGVPGLCVAMTGAYYVFLKYAKLWSLDVARDEGPDGG